MTAALPTILDTEPERVAHLAERALIGATLVLRGTDARDALARVEVADFADPQHRALWTALGSLTGRGLDPDPALVVPELLALGLLTRDRAGLVNAQVADLLGACPVPAVWPVYAAAVLRESARRTVVEVATRAVQAADGPELATVVQVLGDGLAAVRGAVTRALGGDGP